MSSEGLLSLREMFLFLGSHYSVIYFIYASLVLIGMFYVTK